MMMQFSEEELSKIEEYAGLFLAFEEIAVLIGKNINDFLSEIENKKSTAYLAYYKGKTTSKMLIRQNVVKMAKMGSPQAEQLATKYIMDQELNED